MIPIDLHTHSAFSDGLLSPQALCELAVRNRVCVIALCDHDTTDGLAPMAEAVDRLRRSGATLELIPSVELSAGSDGRTHILGYGADAASEPLQTAIAALRENRTRRGWQMVEAMARLGVRIPEASLPQAGGVPFGRPHIARALVDLGVTHTVEQAFDRYLGEGKPAYVPLYYLAPGEAVALLRQARAVPVLAHPMRLGLPSQHLEALIASLAAGGLQGVEAYHPSASRRDVGALDALARRHGLLVTGGSDFHGDRGARARLGGLPGGWRAWPDDLAALRAAMATA